MLEEGQVFVATFDEKHSRNTPFYNFLFLVVVTFSIGYVWYFSIKMRIKINHLTSHKCVPLTYVHIFVLSVFPTPLWSLYLFLALSLSWSSPSRTPHMLDIRALSKQKHKFQHGWSIGLKIYVGYRMYFCFISLSAKAEPHSNLSACMWLKNKLFYKQPQKKKEFLPASWCRNCSSFTKQNA